MVSAVRASSWRFRGRRARARTLERAPKQNKRHESSAVGEWFKRPWEEQWAKGAGVLVNLHWWSRRSALQVGDLQRFHTSKLHRGETSAAVEHPEILAVREDIQRPCGSEQSKYRQRCQGVQVSDGLGGLHCKLRTGRSSAHTTDRSTRSTSASSGPSARCSSRGHPPFLRVGTVEISAKVSRGSS